MNKSIIMIEDSHAKAFFMTVWTPSTATNLKFWNCDKTRYQSGDWETSDQGFLRPSQGDAFLTNRSSPVVPGYCFSGAGNATYVDLYLGEPGAIDGSERDYFAWGMALYGYSNGYGNVQDSGKGEVKQKWVLSLEPGQIWWKQATQGDLVKVAMKRSGASVP